MTARKGDKAPAPSQLGPDVLVAARREVHVGPLPDPSSLAKYDELLPGLADRIVTMAEKQADHRQAIERIVIAGNTDAQKRGQVFGFTLSILVIAVGAWQLGLGQMTLGLAFILGDLVILAAIFVTGRVIQFRERKSHKAGLAEAPAPRSRNQPRA